MLYKVLTPIVTRSGRIYMQRCSFHDERKDGESVYYRATRFIMQKRG
jgi:hypothetical protein